MAKVTHWLCRLFGHKSRRTEEGGTVLTVCIRLGCNHYRIERRRPLRFGCPD